MMYVSIVFLHLHQSDRLTGFSEAFWKVQVTRPTINSRQTFGTIQTRLVIDSANTVQGHCPAITAPILDNEAAIQSVHPPLPRHIDSNP